MTAGRGHRRATRPARIVSGGQTGADRAALDAALAHGVPYGGWCPAGGWAEDLPEPPGLLSAYPDLQEAPSPEDRTVRNVRDSDATLVVRGDGVPSPGTDLTVRTAEALGRPCLVSDGDPAPVAAWLAALGDDVVLNVAGPRASEQADVYERTRRLLDGVLDGVLGSVPERDRDATVLERRASDDRQADPT